MTGADLSFVTVGLSLTVANGFPPPRKGAFAVPLTKDTVFCGKGVEGTMGLEGVLSL